VTARFWLLSGLLVIIVYIGLALLIGFSGPIAITVNFLRVTVAFAVLMLYLPAITNIFHTVPPPSRDYLIAGIVLSWLSSLTFAIWNEAGRIVHVDTSIFTSPIAGFFSLLLVLGGFFHLQAPYVGSYSKKAIAVLVGVAMAIVVVMIAPLFR